VGCLAPRSGTPNTAGSTSVIGRSVRSCLLSGPGWFRHARSLTIAADPEGCDLMSIPRCVPLHDEGLILDL
jgi:hypothetical protein